MRHCMLICLLTSFCSAIAAHAQYTAPAAAQAPAAAPQTKPPPVVCPWITQGTVARLLGGEVSVMANVSEAGEGVCKFARQAGPPAALEIAVSKTALTSCSTDSVGLRAIGNEAALCSHAGPHSDAVQMISSRVRDQYFTVTITTHGAEKTVKARDTQDEPIYRIAEQVAGSLF